GLAADQHERRWDEPAAEDAVELRHSRRDPVRLLGIDVDQAKERPLCLGRLGSAMQGRGLGHQGSELAAARTPAEPPAGRVAALRARVLDDRRLRHEATVAAGPDGNRSEFGTSYP